MANNNWLANAALCELISIGFKVPTEDMAQAVSTGEYAGAIKEYGSACGLDEGQTELAAEKISAHQGADSTDLFHTLRVEYTSLYVNKPKPKVSPYASIWWAEDNELHPVLFVNARAMAIERYLRQFGLGQAEGKNDPLDSISTMFEFLQYCSLVIAGTLEPVNDVPITPTSYQDFIDEYLVDWVTRFADATIESTEESFYAGMALVLKAFMR